MEGDDLESAGTGAAVEFEKDRLGSDDDAAPPVFGGAIIGADVFVGG